MRRRERQEVECRQCGTVFNLSAQTYFDNLCPSCVAAGSPERTWPGCVVCNERIPPEQREYVTVQNRSPGGPSTERVPVHGDCDLSRPGLP
jgi:hypothetical protein